MYKAKKGEYALIRPFFFEVRLYHLRHIFLFQTQTAKPEAWHLGRRTLQSRRGYGAGTETIFVQQESGGCSLVPRQNRCVSPRSLR